MVTPKITQHCWYCGSEIQPYSQLNGAGFINTGYPSFILKCDKHIGCDVFFYVDELSDCSMKLYQTMILIKPANSVWICPFVSHDVAYWFVAPNVFELSKEMLNMTPEQLTNKIKNILAFT